MRRKPKRGEASRFTAVPVATAPSFSPLSLRPHLWLDAADPSTITSSSGLVSQWSDKSGNERHATQGTSALQPSTGTTTKNGLNVISFTGRHLTTPDASGVNPQTGGVTYFIVSVQTTATTGQAWGQRDGTGLSRLILQYLAGTTIQSATGGLPTSVLSVTYANVWNLLRIDLPAGVTQIRVTSYNGGALSTSDTTTGNEQGNGGYVFGNNKTLNTAMTGHIAEVIACPYTQLQQAQQVERYLNAKWSVY